MKKTGYFILALLAFVACQTKDYTPVEDGPEGGVYKIVAKFSDETRVSVTDGGKASWQSGDKIALYDGSSFVTFNLTDPATGEFSGPAGSYTGLAVYPADGVYTWSVDADNLILDLPAAYTYAPGQTSAPMIAKAGTGETTFYFTAVSGLFKFPFSHVPDGVNAFRFVTGKKVNGSFNLGVPAPGTTVCELADAAGDDEKTITVTIPDGQRADDMVFYIPVPVTGAEKKYEGFTVSLLADATPYVEVTSAKTWELGRHQMQRLKNTDCDAALPEKFYLVGSTTVPTWSFDGYTLGKVSKGVYWAAGVPMDFGGGNDCGFRLHTAYNDWNNLYTYKDGGYDAGGIQLAYHDAGGDPPQILPGQYGYSSGRYDVTFNVYTKKLTLVPAVGPEKLYLVGTPFTWSWNFSGTPMTRVALSASQYSASDIVMNLDADDWGFRIYTGYDDWNNLYTYKDGGYDTNGVQLAYHDAGGDPPQIFLRPMGFTSGTYDLVFDISTMWLALTKK